MLNVTEADTPATRTPVIDAWGQHPTLRHMADPMFDSLRRWTKQPVPTAELPVAATIASMDQAGVDRMLISAWEAPGRTLISNAEVADFVSQAPDRLTGVGSVNIARPMDAVREVRRCVNEYAFKAIRVLPWLWELPPTDRRFYPVYAACVEEGVPFCTQIGHTGPLMPSEPGRPLYLDQVALDFPELKIVGGHIGWPWTEEAIAVATKHENVFIDTSAYAVNRYPPELVQFMKGHGRGKVLFGTNYPMMPHAQALKGHSDLGLNEDSQTAFLSGNAERVFGL